MDVDEERAARFGGRPHLDPAQIEAAVTAAIAAPSILNSQPWRFRATPEAIDVFAVPERAPLNLDPMCREVFLSLGAAILNLRLGIGAQGHDAVAQLMPAPADRTYAARVRVGAPRAQSPDEAALYAAIPRRHANRLPFAEREVPLEDIAHLQEAAATEGAHLDPVSGWHRPAILEALHDADQAQRADEATQRDVRRFTLGRPDDAGVPTESLGPRSLDPNSPVRDLTLGAHIHGRPAAEFEKSSQLAVLLTSGDSPIDWLRAGMALERVLLEATVRGLSVGLMSHATEVSDLRPFVRDPTSRWRSPQIVLRIGYGEDMPATPRLPLTEVIELHGVS